ncbi:unnamed protein product [Aureobasidium vineae]|uniref:CENP-V/GFA domain-containing protein n=1 Tax=Aureobasidium vineae TaxID=2773715 RepID=A0A9N8JVF7_9PEZI|nr:unnamed protein product [Aureobasidium vineae]
MYTGSCFCKKITVELSAEPQVVISGSAYSYNFIVGADDYKISGTPEATDKVADSGNKVKNYYCKDCGSPLYGGAVAESGIIERVVIKGGIFDDVKNIQNRKPSVEIYVEQRLDWVKPVEDCTQLEGMPS